MIYSFDQCNPELPRLLALESLPEEELYAIEQHVDGCAKCRDLLDSSWDGDRRLEEARKYLSSDETWFDWRSNPAEKLDFLAPTDWPDSLGRLGAYEVKGMLGAGGMGVVLKALDPALNRFVAIKVLSSSLAGSGAARRRFLREARAAAAVVHEHVVGVFAVVESNQLPFIVMEYVPGGSLQERIDKQGPLSLPEILRIGMQTASGLAAAHAQGLVHRDVKPANILLENSVERVRLTDFGLARAAADAGMTHSGFVAGTPHYMAPEQARGESADHRSDVFSLGSTLYAMAAGHPPFRADSALAVLRRVCDEEPTSLRAINSDVPDWLDALVGRLMAKEPEDRIQTAQEAADLLGGCLAHVQQPLVAPIPDSLARECRAKPTGRPLKRLAKALICATVVVAACTMLFVSTAHMNGIKPKQDASAAAPAARQSSSTAEKPVDIDRLAKTLRQHAEEIRASLSRPSSSAQDSISMQTQALLIQAQELEREMSPLAPPTQTVPDRARRR